MSSSESEDENLRKFAASVDTTVFSNKLYNKNLDEDEDEKPKVELKSQRTLDVDETVFQSEINVSSAMQKFVGNKLSKLIENQIEFVEVNESIQEDPAIDNVRLLSGSRDVIKFVNEPDYVEDRQKVAIKRRNVDGESEQLESEKLRMTAINSDLIRDEVKLWNKKPKHQLYEYKNIKGIDYNREPQNEFTKARNKNNWNESKIKGSKCHNPPMCEVIKKSDLFLKINKDKV